MITSKSPDVSTLKPTVQSSSQVNLSCYLWGKAGWGAPENHMALPAHLLATAAYLQALLQLPGVSKSICAAWGIDKSDLPLGALLWAAALHDLGKAHPWFQFKRLDIVEFVRKLSGCLEETPESFTESFDHGNDGGRRLLEPVLDALRDEFFGAGWGLESFDALRGLMYGSFSHHGHQEHHPLIEEPAQFSAAGIEMSKALARLFVKRHGPFKPLKRPSNGTVLGQLLAGYIALADWFASRVESIPYINCKDFAQKYPSEREWNNLYEHYVTLARFQLLDFKIDNTPHLSGWEAKVMGSFSRNAVQRATVAAGRELMLQGTGGGLIIIEGPMGCGKTEAAFLVGGGFIDAQMAQGISFGLPAQASANMVARRMSPISLAAYGVKANLSHANSKFVRHREAKTAFAAGTRDASTDLDEWITAQGKRSFLAPMCASTVDQMELAVMDSAHGSVRLASLSRQVVVIDEVHAYDTYMQRIVRTLLQALGACQVPVVLLSATLPAAMRKAFLDAYALGAGWKVEKKDQVDPMAYPLISYLGEHCGWRSIPVTWDQPSKRVRIRHLIYVDTARVATEAIKEARKGRCVAIICNTKRSARGYFDTIMRLLSEEVSAGRTGADGRPVMPVEVTLLHSRLRGEDRIMKQDNIESIAGRGSTSAQRAGQIFVATQVLEQSIDIDVDFMISEPAPEDLMLQRMGRLFRHDRPERNWEPVFCMITPTAAVMDGVADPQRWWKSTVDGVYKAGGKVVPSVNEMLKIAHSNDPYVELPKDIPRLVAAVYKAGEMDEEELTLEQSQEDLLAQHRVLRLTNPIHSVGVGTSRSSQTRNITQETGQVLFVQVDKRVDLPDGSIDYTRSQLSILSHKGDVKLPPMLSNDRKRMNMEFLTAAQSWLLPVHLKSATDDPDHFLVNCAEWFQAMAALKAAKEAEQPAPDFLILPCALLSRSASDIRMSVGVEKKEHGLHYSFMRGMVSPIGSADIGAKK